MYKIGINDTHNSSIAIFDENKIIFVSEEERFSRCKQISGFPFYAAKYALKNKTTLKTEALKTGLINEKDYEKIVNPKKMIYPA